MEFLTNLAFPAFAIFIWYSGAFFFVKVASGYSPLLDGRYHNVKYPKAKREIPAHE